MDSSTIINIDNDKFGEYSVISAIDEAVEDCEEDDNQDDDEEEEEESKDIEEHNTKSVPSTPSANSSKKKNKKNRKSQGNNSSATAQSKKPQEHYYATNKNNSKADKGKSIFPNLNNSYSNNKSGGNSNTNNNNNNNVGGKDKDFVKQIREFSGKFRKLSNYPLDSWILHLFYRWGFVLFYGLFLNSWVCWYIKDPIICISLFDASKTVHHSYINICYSYPYLEDPLTKERRYILFYRWIHFSCLVIGFIFYLPRSLIKIFDNLQLHSLLDQLTTNGNMFDEKNFANRRALVMMYVYEHLGVHKKQTFLYILLHIFAACSGLLVANFLDFNLQGRFLYLPGQVYPFNRDVRMFTDALSRTFPPIVNCTIGPSDTLFTPAREENYMCHLTLMEMYEKIFFVLWFFIFIIVLLALLYSLFCILMFVTPFRHFLLYTSYNPAGSHELRRFLAKHLKIGDFFLLYKIKHLLSDMLFYFVLKDIQDAIKQRKLRKVHDEGEDFILAENPLYHPTSTPVPSAPNISVPDNPNLRCRK